MKFRILISACLFLFVLASCGTRDENPSSSGTTTGGTTTGDSGNPFGSTTTGTTDGGTNANEGSYFFDVLVNINQGPECEETSGAISVSGNVITGTIDNPTDISSLAVSGQIGDDGVIAGAFIFDGGATYGSFSGNVVSSNYFEGDWEDVFGCEGTWVADQN